MSDSENVKEVVEQVEEEQKEQKEQEQKEQTEEQTEVKSDESSQVSSQTDAAAKPADQSASITFKLVVPHAFMGAVIGKQGANVKRLRELTPCRISILDAQPGVLYRTVQLQGTVGDVQQVLPHIFGSILQGVPLDTFQSLFGPSSNPADPTMGMKVLVSPALIGSVIGKSGANINEMREATGAMVKIPKEDPMMPSVERVVEVTGTLAQVLHAMTLLAARLPKSESMNPQRRSAPSSSSSSAYSLPSSSASYSLLGSSSSSSQKNATMFASAVASGKTVAQVTVSNESIGRVIGKGGNYVSQIRQCSGSDIKISEPEPGKTDRIITLIGTPESNQIAQYLIAARTQMVSIKDAMQILTSQAMIQSGMAPAAAGVPMPNPGLVPNSSMVPGMTGNQFAMYPGGAPAPGAGAYYANQSGFRY
eukprot:GILI01006008.1.p1 GENE.GILI01006008.1~~GILI01006008.1.p1  ORF type:complete len:421 (+),score=138.78 GILI01006008.1:58-1320(+)